MTIRNLASALALALLTLPVGVSGLGLGDIELLSALNEPLDAKIPLRSVTPGESDALRVTLASSEQFERAGVDRAFVLTRLQFSVVENPNGQFEIQISTRGPLAEPFLNFLVEVDWPQGRTIREYTVLLDPPVYGAAITAIVEEAVTTVETLPKLDEPEPIVVSTEESSSMAMPETTSASPPGTYEVKSSDTLWSLANRFRAGNSASIQQTMLAMLRANPSAFAQQNVNTLRAGSVLRLPGLQDATTLSAADALAEVKRHHASWQEYRQSITATTAAAPSGAPTASEASGDSAETVTEASGETAAGQDSRLELISGGDATLGVGGASIDVAGLRNELTTALEQIDSQRLENDEMQGRLSDAEGLITDLQRLIELKDDDIAALQSKLAEAEVALADIQAGLTQPEPAPEPEPVAEPEPTAEPEPVAEPEPELAQTTTTPDVPLPGPQKAPQSFVDKYLGMVLSVDPIILAAGGGGVLLIALIGFMVVRRRRAAEWVDVVAVEEDVAREDDAATEMRGETFPDEPFKEDSFQDDATELSGLAATVGQEDVTAMPVAEPPAPPPVAAVEEDPLEGLNIYLAYEDYDNATKLVQSVIAKYPDRQEYKLRLLEIFYAAKNTSAFEASARELQSVVGDDNPLMDKARNWWADLSPERALFGEAPDGESTGDAQAADADDIFDVTEVGGVNESDTMEISLDDVEADGEGGGVDFDLGFEFDGAQSPVEPEVGEPTGKMDFDLEAEDQPAGMVGAEVGEPTADIDFDLTSEEGPAVPEPGPVAAEESTGEIDFEIGSNEDDTEQGAINLDLGDDTAFDLGAGTDAPADEGLDFALDFDTGAQDDGPAETQAAAPASDADDGLDFALDLDTGADDAAPTEVALVAEDDGLDFALDLDAGEADEAPAATEAATQAESAADALDFALDLGDDLGDDNAAEAQTTAGDGTGAEGDGGFDLGLDLDDDTEAGDFADIGLDIGEVTESTDDGEATQFALRDVEPTPEAESEGGTGAQDAALDFDLGLDAGEPTVVERVASLDEFPSLDPGAGEPAEAENGLDLSFDSDAAEQGAQADGGLDLNFEPTAQEPGVGSAADEADADDSEATQFMLRDVATPGEPEADDSLEVSLDIEEGAQRAEVAAEEAEGTNFALGEPPEDAEAESLDLVFADEAPLEDAEEAPEISLDFPIEDDPFVPGDAESPAIEESNELDMTLDAEERIGEATSDVLDFTLDVEGLSGVEETSTAPEPEPSLDLGLDEPDPAPAQDATPDFETVQLKADDLARVGAIQPEERSALEDDSGTIEVDTDFEDIFGSEAEPNEEALDFEIELPDSAAAAQDGDFEIELPDSAAAAQDGDVADASSMDLELDAGASEEASDEDLEQTQFMLRDIAAITSEPDKLDEEDEQSRTLVLGRDAGDIDEMQTKLDLAQAYIDMGDTEGARGILGEVMAEGNDAQQGVAKGLLSKLN